VALKVNESFFRFVSMGAAGAEQALEILKQHGHDPRELDRYATSKKIWQTKIKRLRLPDLFCLRCGARFEVRAKTNLEVKMSDSPTVAGRTWDAGLRDEDIVLYVQCGWSGNSPVPADRAEAFSIRSLRAAIGSSVLGPPKSAGEGAERDRKWPTLVPNHAGEVVEVSNDTLKVRLDTGRSQSYRLARKHGPLRSYVSVGDRFQAGSEILAGVLDQKASLGCAGASWNPLLELQHPDALTRFAAVKALGFSANAEHVRRLQELVAIEEEPRVRLEAIAALVRLGDPSAEPLLFEAFAHPARDDLRMETVLIAGEIANSLARDALRRMLGTPDAAADEELRAALLWSLGADGCQDLETILEYLGDESDLAAAHAAVAVGTNLPATIRDQLMTFLDEESRASATAAWVLQHASENVVESLVQAADPATTRGRWAIAILGKRSRAEVEPRVQGRAGLKELLAPWWTMDPESNWLAAPEAFDLVNFVEQQAR